MLFLCPQSEIRAFSLVVSCCFSVKNQKKLPKKMDFMYSCLFGVMPFLRFVNGGVTWQFELEYNPIWVGSGLLGRKKES